MKSAEFPRLLLTTVFQPYGVADSYADGPGMQMELFNNQVTREQGVHSPRATFWTFPLYFLAENIDVPATVLDFPRWKDFVAELENGYSHVGISFIQTNVFKAKRMAEYIRETYPGTKIILGGYGAGLPDIGQIVPCDEICAGEGIEWLRRYFGEDASRPIRHPILRGTASRHFYGLPLPARDSAVIFPGLGCDRSCYFCSTSAKYGHRYIPLLNTGADIFRVCEESEKLLGVTRFVVIDENFLATGERARELLSEMESHSKAYSFSVFSSVDTVRELGVDFLVRLGVIAVWIGIEAPGTPFAKLKGTDIKPLVSQLQANGISVITSSILFMEHHDSESLERDIRWAIDVGADFHQFMALTALPGTPLYERFKKENKLVDGFPYTAMTGQGALGFHHPHLKDIDAAETIRRAFELKYKLGGAGMLNMALTAVTACVTAKENDSFGKLRNQELRKRALVLRPLLLAAYVLDSSVPCLAKARQARRLFRDVFGPASLKDWVLSCALLCSACVEWLRIGLRRRLGLGELVRQPPMRRIEYDRTAKARAP